MCYMCNYNTFILIQIRPMQELGLAINAMDSDSSLWDCYLSEFITHKLKLPDQGDTPQGDIAEKILHTYFRYLQEKKAIHKIAELHCYVRIYQLNLGQIMTILRPLSKVEKVSEN